MAQRKPRHAICNPNWREETKKYIDTVITTLVANGEYSEIYDVPLILMGNEYDLYTIAQEDIRKNGITQQSEKGLASANPSVAIAKNSLKSCLEIQKQFGLTLYSKKKINKDEKSDESSPLEEFLKSEYEE